MATPKFSSISGTLASIDATKAGTMQSILDLILRAFPELEAKIAWNVPTIHRSGKYVAGLCAYRNHLTFSPWSPQIMEDFKPRLEKFVVFKNCFPIPVDWEIDPQRILDMVRARVAELG